MSPQPGPGQSSALPRDTVTESQRPEAESTHAVADTSSNDVSDAPDNKVVALWSRALPNECHYLITKPAKGPTPSHVCKLRWTLVKQISRQKVRVRLRRNQNCAQTANNRSAACGTRLTRDNSGKLRK